MTNKVDPSGDTRKASLLAVHLVSQVLQEASLLVNAAYDSGEPWLYVSSLKKNRNSQMDESYNGELTYVVSKADQDTIVTSTPQKMDNKIAMSNNEGGIVGQGDEESEVKGYELRRSTSMFINHLFDMSDVEHLVSDEPDMIQNRSSRSEDVFYQNVYEHNFKYQSPNNESSKSLECSSYSLLSDALNPNIPKDDELQCVLNKTTDVMNNNDLAVYENSFLTMNRDYEQWSEDEEHAVLDPKTVSLQEIELLPTVIAQGPIKTSGEQKKLNAVSGVSTGTSSRKSTIVRRCRHHGAKLLSCLKGLWWYRKLPSKSKVSRTRTSVRGLCPLSPNARHRAASLLDHKNLRTPSPTSLGWKFNTVNEALVHSSHWKDFGLKMSLDKNDKF